MCEFKYSLYNDYSAQMFHQNKTVLLMTEQHLNYTKIYKNIVRYK